MQVRGKNNNSYNPVSITLPHDIFHHLVMYPSTFSQFSLQPSATAHAPGVGGIQLYGGPYGCVRAGFGFGSPNSETTTDDNDRDPGVGGIQLYGGPYSCVCAGFGFGSPNSETTADDKDDDEVHADDETTADDKDDDEVHVDDPMVEELLHGSARVRRAGNARLISVTVSVSTMAEESGELSGATGVDAGRTDTTLNCTVRL
jgi:hypothetical protein